MITTIIVAAGKSKRFNKNTKKHISKPYILLNDKPVIWHTINVFEKHPLVKSIVVVTNQKDESICKRTCKYFKKIYRIVYGGKYRQDSVFSGLKNIPIGTDIVLIHDAVRPFIIKEMITKLIKSAQRNKASILAIPINDTVKKNHKTIDREKMLLVQTPQAFSYKLLLNAYTNAYKYKFYETDDSTLIERIGHKTSVVEGSPLNIKITTYDDFLLAKAIYQVLKQKAKIT